MSNKKQRSTKNIQPLGGKQSGLFFTVTVVSILLTSLIFGSILSHINQNGSNSFSDWYIYLTLMYGGIALFAAILVGIILTKVKLKQGIGKIGFSHKYIYITALVGIGMMFGLSELNNIIVKFFNSVGYKTSEPIMPKAGVATFFVCTLTLCLIPALFEELIFRGFILKGIEGFGEINAVIISALMFAFFHMSPEKTVYQFVAGVLFAILAVKSKSILPSAIVHFANNFIVIIFYYYVKADYLTKIKPFLTIIGIVCLVFGLVWIYFKDKPKKGYKTGFNEFVLYSLAGIVGVLMVWLISFATSL